MELKRIINELPDDNYAESELNQRIPKVRLLIMLKM